MIQIVLAKKKHENEKQSKYVFGKTHTSINICIPKLDNKESMRIQERGFSYNFSWHKK